MHVIVRFRAIALGLAITVTGCASPPNADVDAAKAAVDKAAADRAGQYAGESLKAAQDAPGSARRRVARCTGGPDGNRLMLLTPCRGRRADRRVSRGAPGAGRPRLTRQSGES